MNQDEFKLGEKVGEFLSPPRRTLWNEILKGKDIDKIAERSDLSAQSIYALFKGKVKVTKRNIGVIPIADKYATNKLSYYGRLALQVGGPPTPLPPRNF